MHAQEFSSAWPAVLDDILEFIALTMASCAARPAPLPLWSMKSSSSAPDQIMATGLAMFLP